MDHFYMSLHVFNYQQRSTFQVSREVIKEGGFGRRGLSKGLTATLGRHGVFNMVYFSFYHNMKHLAPKPQVLDY